MDDEPLRWADLVVFARFYDTQLELRQAADRGVPPFSVTRWAWDWVREHGTPYVYDTDDDALRTALWNNQYATALREAETIREMARRAALVTVATPALAARYGAYNRNVRVIRNAVDPDLYRPTTERVERPLTALFYACAESRLRDYFGELGPQGHQGGQAYHAVRTLGLRAVFFGWEGGRDAPRYFAEVIRYIDGIPAYAARLADIWADIGLAPLVGDDFDRAKSELHWLEYTCVGIPTVAQRLMRPGPYDPIRHGVDGLVARNRTEWLDAVGRLARNPALREDLVAAARERVAAEYDYRVRAQDWADAFHAALE